MPVRCEFRLYGKPTPKLVDNKKSLFSEIAMYKHPELTLEAFPREVLREQKVECKKSTVQRLLVG